MVVKIKKPKAKSTRRQPHHSANWGGARPGAGGKPKEPGGAQMATFSLTAEDRALIDTWRAEHNSANGTEPLREMMRIASDNQPAEPPAINGSKGVTAESHRLYASDRARIDAWAQRYGTSKIDAVRQMLRVASGA